MNGILYWIADRRNPENVGWTPMSVAIAWGFNVLSANLALLQHHSHSHGNGSGKYNQDKLARSSGTASLGSFHKRKVSLSFVCGCMLFALGLISLLTGHVVSHLEWYSQQVGKRSFYSRLVIAFPLTITMSNKT